MASQGQPERTRPPRERILARYGEAVARTDALIDPIATAGPKHPAAVRARAVVRMARLRRFLDHLGAPLGRFPVVHVGGTSGKGSTATAIAAILGAAGMRVGLHTSPYLQVATEKLQIAGRLVDPLRFAALVESVLAAAETFAEDDGRLTYGEVWMGLTALAFANADVDVAVIEVGAGGRFDLTNVVTPAVSVITSVGLDHTETLGETIAEIAWHKAGIVKPGAPVVSAVADPEAIDVIAREANATGSEVIRVVPGETFAIVDAVGGHARWRERGGLAVVHGTPMPGRFQATNAATAVAAVRAFGRGRFALGDETIDAGLAPSAARLPGRLEVVRETPTVVLDGAHNPEKVGALAADLSALRGNRPRARLIAVVGTLEAKDHRSILAALLPRIDVLVCTTPRVLAKPGADAGTLADTARELGFAGAIEVIADPAAAVAAAIDGAGPDDVVLVTGSLYLIGNVRGRWYPDDEILLQRTPWPAVASGSC